jgi:hypothetical protein
MTLKPDPDDPRRPLPVKSGERGTGSIVPVVVAGLALFVAAYFVLTPGGTSAQLKTPAATNPR